MAPRPLSAAVLVGSSSALTLSLLASCAAPAGALHARSAGMVGCHPAHELRVSGHRPGDPHRNRPERWTVAGCGRAHACASFLLTSGEPAHTECVETDDSVVRRLHETSARTAAAAAACPPARVRVQGRLAAAAGASHVFLVQACGRAYRCLTEAVRSTREGATRCEELRGAAPAGHGGPGPGR